MAIKLGDAVVAIAGDRTQLTKDFDAAHRETKSFAQNASSVLKQTFSFVIGDLIAGGIRKISSAFVGLGREALEAYKENEMLGMSLQSLVAREKTNADETLSMARALELAGGEAQDLLKWNQKLAIESPFTQSGVAQAFKMSMAYGFTTKEAKRLTQAMIDFVSGAGLSESVMSQVALALGQIKAKGKLAGQEVLQLVNAGLPVDKILARAFNKTTAEIVDLREKGLIPADDAIEAITKSLERDFAGAAKRTSGTFSGLLSSLNDIKNVGLRNLFEGSLRAIQPYLQRLVDVLGSEDFMARVKKFGNYIGEYVGRALAWVNEQVSKFMAQGGFEGLLGRILSFFDNLGENVKVIYSGGLSPIERVMAWINERMNEFGKLAGSVWKWLSDTLTTFIIPKLIELAQWLGTVIPKAIQGVADFWQGKLLPAFDAVWNYINTRILPLFQGLWDWIIGKPEGREEFLTAALRIANDVTTAITTAWNTIVFPALAGLWTSSMGFLFGKSEGGKRQAGAIENAWNGILDFFMGKADTTGKREGGAIGTLFEWLFGKSEGGERQAGVIENAWNGIVDFFMGKAGEGGKRQGGAFKSIWEWLFGKDVNGEHTKGFVQNMGDRLLAELKKKIDEIVEWVKSGEAQKKFEEIGTGIRDGILKGISSLGGGTDLARGFQKGLSLPGPGSPGMFTSQLLQVLDLWSKGNRPGQTNVSLTNPQFNGVSNMDDFFALLQQLATGK